MMRAACCFCVLAMNILVVLAQDNCGRCGNSPPDAQDACPQKRTISYTVKYMQCGGWWWWRSCYYRIRTETREVIENTRCCDGVLRDYKCYKIDIPENDNCGISPYKLAGERLTQIVGGVDALSHEFPWQVIVSQGRSLCGGTIVGPKHILTAAHCVDEQTDVSVRAGRHYLNRPEPSTEQHVTVRPAGIVIHESYDPNGLQNDIALLRLSTPLQFNNNVTAVCLPSANANYVGKSVVISGWGVTGAGSLSTVLQYTRVLVESTAYCERVFGGLVNIICGSDGRGEAERSSCFGDSGGPMMDKKDGRFTVIGIATFVAEQGCAKGLPFGYVDVSKYVTWIYEEIN